MEVKWSFNGSVLGGAVLLSTVGFLAGGVSGSYVYDLFGLVGAGGLAALCVAAGIASILHRKHMGVLLVANCLLVASAIALLQMGALDATDPLAAPFSPASSTQMLAWASWAVIWVMGIFAQYNPIYMLYYQRWLEAND